MTGLDPAVRQFLVLRRITLGLNQHELADLIGTQQSSVSALERGERDPRFSTLTRWAGALGVRPVVDWEPVEDET